MKQNKLSFDTENLVVDWIGFNIQGSVDIKPIANYLFQTFGFNSIIAKRINGKWKSQDLKYDSRNQFQISFRQHEYDPEYKSFWVGFITELWRDTNDIEFVRQAIGHAKIDTTSQYVKNLSEKKRQGRMLEISVDKVKSE